MADKPEYMSRLFIFFWYKNSKTQVNKMEHVFRFVGHSRYEIIQSHMVVFVLNHSDKPYVTEQFHI